MLLHLGEVIELKEVGKDYIDFEGYAWEGL
jgi:hypothetical protein